MRNRSQYEAARDDATPPREHPHTHGRLLRWAGAVAVLALHALAGAQLNLVVTLAPYQDVVQRVAGPDAQVRLLLPPGASPHGFDPTPSVMRDLQGTDLMVMNGGVDAWAARLADAAGDVATFVALEALETAGSGLQPIGDDHGDANPHVWLDPLRMRAIALTLGEMLGEVDPPRAEAYLNRAEGVAEALDRLHQDLEDTLAPVRGAPFVPFHDAWPYFAERYGLNLVLEIEPFPGREPSPRRLAEVVQAIRDTGARAIFNEAQLHDRPARVVADEAGVDVATLDPLGGVDGRRTFEDLLRFNASVIVRALGEDAPP